MKRKYLALILIVTLVFPVLAGCTQKAEEQAAEETPQEFNLQFATFWPAIDFQVAEGHQAWADEISNRVAAETPHKVTFELQPGGVLLAANEIYDGVSEGVAHIGSTCPSYTPGFFPLTMGLELPGYNNDNALVASVTMHEAWKQSLELQKEYEDVKVMFFWATGPGDFITNSPVKTLEDLSGQQIRAAGGTALAVTALGGTPVGMPMSESYVALDSGIVNGILGPTDILKGFRLAEVTRYITKTPFAYNVVFVKVMNKDTWNSLPASVQKIFDEVNENYVMEYGKLRADHTVLGQQYAINQFGHEVFELEPAERDRWMERIASIPQKWVTDNNGQEMLDLYKQLDEKYSEMYGSYGE